MSIDLIVTILIAVLPPIFGWINSKKNRFLFVIYSNTNLYNKLQSKFSDISIYYKDKNVERNLYLLKGYIFYVGEKDINESSSKMYLEVADDSKFVDFVVASKPDGMELNHTIEKNKVFINFDMIKKDEYIYTEALVEIDEKLKKHIDNRTDEDLILSANQLNHIAYRLKYRIKDIANAQVLSDNYKQLITKQAFYSSLILIAAIFFLYIAVDTSTQEYGYDTVYVLNGKVLPLDKLYTSELNKRYKYRVDSVEAKYKLNTMLLREVNTHNRNDSRVDEALKEDISKVITKSIYSKYLKYRAYEREGAILTIKLERKTNEIRRINLIDAIDKKTKRVLSKRNSSNFLSLIFGSGEKRYRINDHVDVMFLRSSIIIKICAIIGLILGTFCSYTLTLSIKILYSYRRIDKKINLSQNQQ